MRAAAPIEVTVRPSAGWAAFIATLCLLSVAGIGAWAIAAEGQHDPRWVAAAVVTSGIIALAALRAVPAAASPLRWDGSSWHLGEPASSGTLQVALDLGDWMLLRFVAGAGWRRRVSWMALQRGSAPGEWHALRCAVFAGHRGFET